MRNGELYSYKEIYNTITKELTNNQLTLHPLNWKYINYKVIYLFIYLIFKLRRDP